MSGEHQRTSFVIGTAGHIDHGKSTLVRALTGIDPDRLAEEKARGMTIDLGFAWLESPAGHAISIVDVPGHERFIKNMLAGVGGIDAALLVIAADEGPMPQTIEHLAIIDLLGVPAGLIAITKRDLVDNDWLDLVVEEVRECVAGTVLADAPIVPVSASTGTGLKELLTELDHVLAKSPAPASFAKPRLPIDRVFTIPGFGTVVTGTLVGGDFTVGQELIVMPGGMPTRVRGLQTHSRKADRVSAGTRVAVNVAGLAVEDIERGDILTVPGLFRPSPRIDVRLKLLTDSPVQLAQNDEVDFFAGARELPARITLLDRERLEPGDTGWVQLRFREPVAVMKGDRFIIRRPSPGITIGGGEIVDAAPVRHRRFRPEVLSALETLAAGSPSELVLQALENGPIDFNQLKKVLPAALDGAQVDEAIARLVADGSARNLSDAGAAAPKPAHFLVSERGWQTATARIRTVLDAFHRAQPLRIGIPREELRSRLKLAGPQRMFDDMIRTARADGVLIDDGATIRLHGFSITLDRDQQNVADRYLAALRSTPLSPPSPTEFGIDPDLLGALIDLGRVVKIADGVVYDRGAYEQIEKDVVDLMERNGSITLAGFRDHFQTSRKYAQATLEYLDQRRITRRVGDERVRFTGSGAGQLVGGS